MSDVTLTIDGRKVSVPRGTTIFDAARLNGIPIPTLCHQQHQTPVGVCRVCVVDVHNAQDKAERVFAASCIRECADNTIVYTDTADVKQARRTLVELLMADHPSPCARQEATKSCELETMAAAMGAVKANGEPRFARRLSPRGRDDSSLSIAVDHEACILCDRCVRGCDDIAKNFVIGRTGKGYTAGIAFDLNLPMGESTCVSCGECMVSCPTGALTNKKVVGTELGGETLDPKWLLSLPVFKGVSGTFLDLNKHAVVKRTLRPGEVICREGEYGSTAFYILEGTVDIFIGSPIAHVKQESANSGWLSTIKSRLANRKDHVRDEESRRSHIPIDGPVDLPYANPIAQLGAGDLFGEMTCMSFHPRSATVRAATDVVVLEMLRNVLDILQRNKTFRAELDRKYRQRALETHLRNVPVFKDLPAEVIDELRDKVELQRFAPGTPIVRQGDPADAFYVVRLGFVKVSEARPGGEMTLTYLGRSDYFGEMGLLEGGVRTATCTALDHVDVVRIAKSDFDSMMERFPAIRAGLQQVAAERAAMNQARARSVEAVPIHDFLSQGLMEAQSLLLLDLEKCTRCDQCVRACADAHDGVTRLVREGLRFDKYLVATSCRQCRDPMCMPGCPVGAIRRRGSLEIVIEDWCIGCGRCVNNCPYGNLNLHPFEVQVPDPQQPSRRIASTRKKATGCDLCMEHEEPSCVYACPHDAAHRVEPLAFFASMREGRQPDQTRRKSGTGTEGTSK
jgi:CRP-like cAMP-binding protein/Fe-S-cluster-containing dehydrogenase component